MILINEIGQPISQKKTSEENIDNLLIMPRGQLKIADPILSRINLCLAGFYKAPCSFRMLFMGGRGDVVKRIRAYGGCSGKSCRGRTWRATKRIGEQHACNDPMISEWGNLLIS